MNFLSHNLYHIYNQGNNRQALFWSKEDYITFLRQMGLVVLPHCDLVAYCLMPNHFHLVVYTDERVEVMRKQGGLMLDDLTNGIRKLLSGYARIYNKKYNRSGSLFRQKTKSKLLSNDLIIAGTNLTMVDYCTNCFHYVHLNPLRANLVERLEDWEFSSFRDYAGLRSGSLCNRELASRFCSYSPPDFVNDTYRNIGDEREAFFFSNE